MANTRSAIKRVRQSRRRRQVNAPRRTAARTYIAKALAVATGTAEGDPASALAAAVSALDRAAKTGAIHPNAAARRKSRLALKVNAALGGVALEPAARARAGKSAAAKAARARVAAARARTETGPKTAAEKARVALAKSAGGAAPKTRASSSKASKAAPAPATAPSGSKGNAAKVGATTARRKAKGSDPTGKPA